MDFSTVDNRKKHIDGEVNYSPIPLAMTDKVSRSGLRIAVFYEKVRSGIKKTLPPRRFPYYALTHLIGGDGFYYDHDDGTIQQLKPGDGVLVVPGKEHEYGGLEKYFIEDSICFLGPTADALLQAGIIRNSILRIGSERRLLPIIQKVRDPGIASQFEANIMLQQLLLDLFRENSARHTTPHRHMEQLLKELHAAPGKWWTVEEMAEYCNISANHLRTLFRTTTGMTPKHYIDQLKMKKAGELLCSTRLKIGEIADYLGYADHYHFIRRFTACIGISPARYRKAYSIVTPMHPASTILPLNAQSQTGSPYLP